MISRKENRVLDTKNRLRRATSTSKYKQRIQNIFELRF